MHNNAYTGSFTKLIQAFVWGIHKAYRFWNTGYYTLHHHIWTKKAVLQIMWNKVGGQGLLLLMELKLFIMMTILQNIVLLPQPVHHCQNFNPIKSIGGIRCTFWFHNFFNSASSDSQLQCFYMRFFVIIQRNAIKINVIIMR